ncbi:MAG: carboxypeptidase regulatory-like domain-containing protein, partial [Pyrinomonadaceae bacterium]|nr:carboxypeptidase regulatory-like domain-containing protein [Pyrinomonadaceae bacterium]
MLRRSTNATAFIISLLLFILVQSNAPAQQLDTINIEGRILDQNGAALPGASVTATLTASGTERTALADEEGRYRLVALAPGLYNVRASFPNFAGEERKNLEMVAGRNLQLDFILHPAEVVAEQTVTSDLDAPAVDTTRTVVGGTITAREAEALPLASRSPLDLIFTLGGVTEEPLSTRDLAEDRNTSQRRTPEEAGTFALSGGPAYSNNLTIDGLDNNDDRAARERFQPSVETVAEVQVITNQFSAEYGRASGGRINLRTRGGARQFHARAFYFFRDEALNSNTVRNSSLGFKRLPLQEHDPGFTLSGPLRLPVFFGPAMARLTQSRT